jgi:hypothetical protein
VLVRPVANRPGREIDGDDSDFVATGRYQAEEFEMQY